MSRPFIELSEEETERIGRMLAQGITVEEACLIQGISKNTFYRLMKDDEKFKNTIEKGRSIAKMAVTRTAYELATDGKNSAMTMFWLKCRAGWKDGGGDQVTIVTADPSNVADLIKTARQANRAIIAEEKMELEDTREQDLKES